MSDNYYEDEYENYYDDDRPNGIPRPPMQQPGQFPQGQFPQGQQPQGPPYGPPQGPPHGPPQGPPHGPPQGPPHGPPQGPPYGPPQGQYLAPYTPGQHYFGQNAPNMRPPSFMPRRPIRRPGPIRFCENRFTYIWLVNGRDFWTWISAVSRRTIYGYRWNGRRWMYFESDVNDVDTFICVR